MFIVAAEGGTPDTPAVANRLLANQRDIANAVRPFYGDAAAARLKSLLRHHILIAGDLVAAAKAGDTNAVASNEKRWYDNADDIARFLARANPAHWPVAEMRTMMHEHLDLTLAEAVHHLQGQYVADIADYDAVHVQILHMADMLADGIVAQFPGRFR
jgi:hypothetical protein